MAAAAEPDDDSWNSRLPLLSLPTELLKLILSHVQGKAALRRTCRLLRTTVDQVTTNITWPAWSDKNQADLPEGGLPAALLASCPALAKLDCHSLGKCLRSLAGIPAWLQVINLSNTKVRCYCCST